jgi:hypothetical protein
VIWLRGLGQRPVPAETVGIDRFPEAPLRWIETPTRALTAEELRADPRQARVVRRRWLERQP